MQVNARVDYALRAVVHIATANGNTVTKRELADSQQIPARFLENILVQLVRTGILRVARGSFGGYTLGQPAGAISVADVVRAIDGPLAGVRGEPPEQIEYPDNTRQVRAVWVALRASMRNVLEQTSIETLASGSLSPVALELLGSPGAWERRA